MTALSSLRTRLLLAAALCSAGATRAPAEAPAERPVDFTRQIRPILSDHCFACHGPDAKQRKAKLRLDNKAGAFAELDSGHGFALVPGKPADSILVERTSSTDPDRVMPPPRADKKLTPEQIALLRKWVEQGANWSEHWSFTAAQRPELPKVKHTSWPRNEIDAFILARLERERLQPSPEADRTTLLRRVTLDLTGLPPTPAETDAFLADTHPDAYERVVDRLLKSSRYGEHMARYWLDAARYGDTHGLHLDNYREMWPYRDWVVNAFNRNLSYDRFLTEQLAGDLLPDATQDQVVASGFNRCHVTTSEGGSISEEVYVRNVVDRVDTTGVVFLGLSTGCARCHDHKFDPFRTRDYYQFFAFFNSLDENPLDGNAARYPPILSLATPEQTADVERSKRVIAALRKVIDDEVSRVKYVDPGEAKPAAESLAAWLKAPTPPAGKQFPKPVQDVLKVQAEKRNPAQQKVLHDYWIENVHGKLRTTFDPLHLSLAALEKERDRIEKEVPVTLVSREVATPRPAFILKRGEYDQRSDAVTRGTPSFLPPFPADAPLNRLGFARWLLLPDHPLTARVEVNRLWQHVFGTGLVKTSEDFGSQGEPPSHPELLDWLAVQFREDGWDMKKMMKRLVMSATYRQSSKVTRDRLAKDAENRLLSRGPRFRLDAEMLRDQAMFVSGLMVEKMGGPSVKPPQPAGLWEAVGYVTSNTARFTADTGPDKVHRRSLYTFWKRTAPPPQMTTFDAPSREACRVRRERTNTPLQALLLMNETQYVEASRALAERAMKEGGAKPEERIAYLFRLAAGRKPDAMETAVILEALQEHLARYAKDEAAAKKLIGVGESKPDPKQNAGELAAWTMVANLVLNLDEVINKE
jgi:mono/diheme cytochrome c family protein